MIKFKTDRIKGEFDQLTYQHHELDTLVINLSLWVSNMYHKDIIITHLFRTQEEQHLLYKDIPNPPAFSPHQFWNAIDLRSFDFDQDELDAICTYLNSHYSNLNGKIVAFVHAIPGGAMHFHIQLLR